MTVAAAGRPAVTFVNRPPRSGFLDADLAAVREGFELREVEYPGFPTPRFAWQVVRAALSTSAVYGFFASEHMLLPALVFRLARKPVIVTVGGYDIAADRRHGYGLARSRWRRWMPAAVLRLAHVVLPFSRAGQHELAASFPSATAKAQMVHLGIDADDWDNPTRPPRQGVVTVGYVNEGSWERKGIDRFVALARADAGRRYVLAGRVDPAVEARLAPLPPNLEVTGYLGHDELRELLWGCAVYAQLSWHEAFGVSVLEAVACGCVPIVTEVPALVEVAGDWAVTVPVEDRTGDLAAVQEAEARARAVDVDGMRAEVAERFGSTSRAAALADVIRSAMSQPGPGGASPLATAGGGSR